MLSLTVESFREFRPLLLRRAQAVGGRYLPVTHEEHEVLVTYFTERSAAAGYIPTTPEAYTAFMGITLLPIDDTGALQVLDDALAEENDAAVKEIVSRFPESLAVDAFKRKWQTVQEKKSAR